MDLILKTMQIRNRNNTSITKEYIYNCNSGSILFAPGAWRWKYEKPALPHRTRIQLSIPHKVGFDLSPPFLAFPTNRKPTPVLAPTCTGFLQWLIKLEMNNFWTDLKMVPTRSGSSKFTRFYFILFFCFFWPKAIVNYIDSRNITKPIHNMR